MAGKKFKFRVDAQRRVGLKEVIQKVMTIRGERYSISVGLDSDMNLLQGFVFEQNILIKANKNSKKPIYYPLDDISYYTTIVLQFNRSNKLIDTSVMVYTLSGLCSEDEIYCNRINNNLSTEDKNEIIKKIRNYAVRKVTA